MLAAKHGGLPDQEKFLYHPNSSKSISSKEGIALSNISIGGRRLRAQQLLRSQDCVGLLYAAVPWRLYSRCSIVRMLALYISPFGPAMPKPGGA